MTNGYILIFGEKIKVEDVKPSTTLFLYTKLDLIYRKERTSKTLLEDITGIVETDEPINSVELKKELYK